MERWDSYYHNSWGAYPATYAGASHVRYPVPPAPNGQHGPAPQSVFMSASGRGAHAWSSPSHSQPLEPAEEELVTFSHRREPPFSQLEDDPQSPLSVESLSEDDDAGSHDDQHEKVMVQSSLRIMIVNPSKKKDYVMAKIDQSAVQKGIAFDEMKQLILSIFPSDIPQPDIDKLEFGYIEPGHGLKGRKEWILDDDELLEFLERCEGKKTKLTLWCYSRESSKDKQGKRGSKRSRSKSPIAKASNKPGSSQYDKHTAKMAKVDEIYKQIDDTHGSRYSAEQKRAWAHMIEMGKHDSITQAPKKRFFQSSSSSANDEASTSAPSTATTSSSTTCTTSTTVPASIATLVTSPGRRVSIKSECIDQLQKWHALLDCGAISKDQYDELQATILSDIRKL